jgi:diacylglycerol kinase family enzyme
LNVLAIINKKSKRFNPKTVNECLDMLRTEGINLNVVYPLSVEQTIEVLCEAKGYDLVIIGGGDGTVSLASQCLAHSNIPVSIVPLGRGNTFYKVVYGDTKPELLFKKLSRGFYVDNVDIGVINSSRTFILGLSLGFIPRVVSTSERLRILGGRISYAISAVLNAVLGVNDVLSATVIVDNTLIFKGRASLISIGNTPLRAGRFKLFPEASIKDGFLDVIVIPEVSRVKALRLLRKTLRGDHVKEPLVKYVKAKSIKVILEKPALIEVDGDLVGSKSEVEAMCEPLSLLVAKPYE